jgi:hypothetical protein
MGSVARAHEPLPQAAALADSEPSVSCVSVWINSSHPYITLSVTEKPYITLPSTEKTKHHSKILLKLGTLSVRTLPDYATTFTPRTPSRIRLAKDWSAKCTGVLSYSNSAPCRPSADPTRTNSLNGMSLSKRGMITGRRHPTDQGTQETSETYLLEGDLTLGLFHLRCATHAVGSDLGFLYTECPKEFTFHILGCGESSVISWKHYMSTKGQ